jgi:hypothetical protein
MTRAFSIVILCIVGVFAVFAVEGYLGNGTIRLDPPISYAADFSIQFNEYGIDGNTRHIPGTTRSEFQIEGVSVVSLDLWDKDRTYLILPERHQYARLSHNDRTRAVARLRQLIEKFDKATQPVGTETHEGLQVTKYRMALPGATFHFWVTDDGLLVRFEGGGEADGRSQHIEYMLSNIRVGPQDPSGFELPKGYRQVPSVRYLGR